MKRANIVKLITAIAVCQAAGAIGSVFTVSAIPGWYAGLIKPAFNPPDRIFGPVWIILYTLMGIALYLVWKREADRKRVKQAMVIFMVHLIFNALWSIIFFGLRSPGWAFAEIIVLWSMIVAVILYFRSLNRRSAYLLLPYWAWVTFAALLNFYLWRLNI